MNMKKTALMALMGVVLAGGAVTAASAETPWQANHPARTEVNHRLANQAMRVRAERRDGVISARKAERIRIADRHILRQERRMAARHGGHLTRAQAHRLNREENHVSRHIG
ncbi:MAG TPA: hypothetical protein VHY32_07665 [Caulobacteraceae bacterium]|jgi:hypothetical protein|nr:hypothetical protein [Caulobacteraceae bacterium]